MPPDLVALRHELHRHPNPSDDEKETAQIVRRYLADEGIEPIADDVGGHGLLYKIGEPSVLLRAELDALPMTEQTKAPHSSENEGTHHACGHDGHMAMLIGAMLRVRDEGGGMYALFQPAEETGKGALRCLEHPALDLDVDAAYAIHNVPGLPLGEVGVRDGVAAVASRGLTARMRGATSHASEPHAGRNPINALAHLALDAPSLANQHLHLGADALVTLVHLRGGARRFGVSAGEGELSVTLRAEHDEDVEVLEGMFRRRAAALAEGYSLDCEVVVEEPFPATVNAPECAAKAREAARRAGLDVREPHLPQPWSEDLGHFLRRWPGALILLGSGESQPTLHAPDYDFPDPLINKGVDLWTTLALN